MTDTPEEPPFVIMADGQPFLVFRGWLNRRHKHEAKWVTYRALEPGERGLLETMKLADDAAALYGWPCAPGCLPDVGSATIPWPTPREREREWARRVLANSDRLEIEQAVKLLEEHGYTVHKPKGAPHGG